MNSSPVTRHSSPRERKRPVTVLSGFLGSGKTTLLNGLLASPHGLRIAVMVNDFGDVNIDKDLVTGQSGDVLELSGGCLCCSIRGEFLESARGLLQSGRPFDYLMVETSGLANPLPVAQTFLVPELEQRLRLDAVVTMVDSANIETWLAQDGTAAEQICSADLLVMNKLDLVAPPDVDRVRARLASLNSNARVLPSINARVPAELLLDIDIHRPQRTGRRYHQPAHAEAIQSVSFAADVELDYDRFDRFIESLPDAVYRAKGAVAVRGLRRRVIFHRVGARNVLDQGAPWGGEARWCKAVFLGQDFDGEEILERLRRCAVD